MPKHCSMAAAFDVKQLRNSERRRAAERLACPYRDMCPQQLIRVVILCVFLETGLNITVFWDDAKPCSLVNGYLETVETSYQSQVSYSKTFRIILPSLSWSPSSL
jgi:hypothetical protein